ncbi:MAG: hypothetical protein H7329_16050 [Opitutaceae bacterium]|nr:hypothetical protein [Cytophagales bacterium]
MNMYFYYLCNIKNSNTVKVLSCQLRKSGELVFLLQFILLFIFSSCDVVKKATKYQFANGTYTTNKFHDKVAKVYVENREDTIAIYPLRKKDNQFQLDSLSASVKKFPIETITTDLMSQYFRQTSFDIDFLTLPVKYRFSTSSLPSQLNTNINGAFYFGYRTDIYKLKYKKNILRKYIRQKTHYGFSMGAFTGLGSTAINPWVTENHIALEYDGIVWSKGLAGILAIDNFTIGIGFGWDYLTDKNRKYWIYHNMPWLGLAFGLNLN